jgi:hypothetical protein
LSKPGSTRGPWARNHREVEVNGSALAQIAAHGGVAAEWFYKPSDACEARSLSSTRRVIGMPLPVFEIDRRTYWPKRCVEQPEHTRVARRDRSNCHLILPSVALLNSRELLTGPPQNRLTAPLRMPAIAKIREPVPIQSPCLLFSISVHCMLR